MRSKAGDAEQPLGARSRSHRPRRCGCARRGRPCGSCRARGVEHRRRDVEAVEAGLGIAARGGDQVAPGPAGDLEHAAAGRRRQLVDDAGRGRADRTCASHRRRTAGSGRSRPCAGRPTRRDWPRADILSRRAYRDGSRRRSTSGPSAVSSRQRCAVIGEAPQDGVRHAPGEDRLLAGSAEDDARAGLGRAHDLAPQRAELLVGHPVLRIEQHVGVERGRRLRGEMLGERGVHDGHVGRPACAAARRPRAADTAAAARARWWHSGGRTPARRSSCP